MPVDVVLQGNVIVRGNVTTTSDMQNLVSTSPCTIDSEFSAVFCHRDYRGSEGQKGRKRNAHVLAYHAYFDGKHEDNALGANFRY